jgi:DNA-binding response OmpR family regulator
MDVVVADDSEVTRRVLASTIERCGHRVTPAADGLAALAAYERVRPPLIVLDWQMPELDGLEVCRRIRALPGGQDAFVLMVTGRDATTGLLDALAAGVDDFMTKPVAPTDLEARLRIAERRIEQTIARRAAETALVRAERLASIGEVALALQHEINNPLTSLLMNSQLLAIDGEASEAIRAQASAITAEVRRIADVIRRLRELREPKTVEYLDGARMTNLGTGQGLLPAGTGENGT